MAFPTLLDQYWIMNPPIYFRNPSQLLYFPRITVWRIPTPLFSPCLVHASINFSTLVSISSIQHIFHDQMQQTMKGQCSSMLVHGQTQILNEHWSQIFGYTWTLLRRRFQMHSLRSTCTKSFIPINHTNSSLTGSLMRPSEWEVFYFFIRNQIKILILKSI